MSLKDYEILSLLEDALKLVESELRSKKGKLIDLSKALKLVREAEENSVSAAEKALIKEFKINMEKLDQKIGDEKAIRQLAKIYLHFKAEVLMAKVSYGYSDEDYNLFLTIFERHPIIDYIMQLHKRKEGELDSNSTNILKKLHLISIEDKKTRLAEKGLLLVDALELLELLKSMT